ncbi:MAG: L-serine dehydratase 1 [Nevskia sp.]|nr:L-serine dehydratase 1 [Nevskia sp.]
MRTSLFDLYKIGIGPSSSHTVGPMRAAGRFIDHLKIEGLLGSVTALRVELYGSLALTGQGHGTDRGIQLGLLGQRPDLVEIDSIDGLLGEIARSGSIRLGGVNPIPFILDADLVWHPDQVLPGHPNGMRFTAFSSSREIIEGALTSEILEQRIYYSIGGGFVVGDGEEDGAQYRNGVIYPFSSGKNLLEIGRRSGMRIDQIMLVNECTWRDEGEVQIGIHRLWKAMHACIDRGMASEGVLPGALKLTRRAPGLAKQLQGQVAEDPFRAMDWLNVYAIAVNEENAAGGRIVTAPTNGAAGIVPAVARYYWSQLNGDTLGIERFFLASAAIGVLYKENASISGAEVGCQGEVGVACSMAAAGLAAALGGSNEQVEHAAEIAMEHNLGMTCDPIGGLVQISCIERNAFGAVKAVNAARMALRETGEHKVSLDQVIRIMHQTGLDMQSRYKEISLGGLAVNVTEC